MQQPLSVTELNEQIKATLETTFNTIYVEGEISNLTYHRSGHIYFSIKDNSSVISCVMFRFNAQNLKFKLEVGQKVIIYASLTVYAPRGAYQLICTKIEPSGAGALAIAYEQLKTKLQIKGYFDTKIKKPLPQFPKKIFIITSNTGAAICDMKKILQARYPLAKMILLPTIVQGENAKEHITSNIKKADNLSNHLQDIIIVGRGGGSIEDLWAFNEEIVADAIYEAKTPIISAVGHESDFVISDFVADVRASTPSNAIEISTPNINDLRLYVDSIVDEFIKKQQHILQSKEQQLIHINQSFTQHSLQRRFDMIQKNINDTKYQLNLTMQHIFQTKQSSLTILRDNFALNDPKNKIKTTYAQITKENKPISLETLDKNDIINLEDPQYKITAKILDKIKI